MNQRRCFTNIFEGFKAGNLSVVAAQAGKIISNKSSPRILAECRAVRDEHILGICLGFNPHNVGPLVTFAVGPGAGRLNFQYRIRHVALHAGDVLH